MKTVMYFIIALFLATSSFAAEISEAEVKAFLADWLNAQNTGSYTHYADMYSTKFTGVRRSGAKTYKLDHDAWLKDRKKMFKKKMLIQAMNPEIQLSGQTALIKFEQMWESGSYKDKGEKLLTLSVAQGRLAIIKEEMLFSEIAKSSQYVSKFTSIASDQCQKLPKQINKGYEQLGLYGDECPAPTGWRLFVVVGGDRSWVDIEHDGSIWSTEQDVVYKVENSFGYFPNVTSKRVEWLIDKNGAPAYLIFPVTAQDPEAAGKSNIRYFLIGLHNSRPSLCGITETENDARGIAAGSRKCPTDLPKRSFKASSNNTSKFTSLKEKNCKRLSDKMSVHFDNRNLERSECSAPKDWRVFTVTGGERFWLEIACGGSLWSTEDEIITKGENRFGEFQSLDFDKIEWRVTASGGIKAMIFPVVAQDSDHIGKDIFRYFVINLSRDSPRFCGAAETMNDARYMADRSNDCKTSLPAKKFTDYVLTSKYTSMREKDCKSVTSTKMMTALGNDSISECPSLEGWRLFKIYDEEEARSWVSLVHNKSIWTTIDQVWGGRYEFGHFPNVDSSRAEWRVSKDGEPKALIFKVIAQSPDNSSTILSHLYVLGLRNDIPFFCGTAKSVEAARVMADNPSACTIELQKVNMPR